MITDYVKKKITDVEPWSKGSQSEYGTWIWPYSNGSLFSSLLLFSFQLYFRFGSSLCSPWWVWQLILPFCIFKINLTTLFHQSETHILSVPSPLLPVFPSLCRSFSLFMSCFYQVKMSNNINKKKTSVCVEFITL